MMQRGLDLNEETMLVFEVKKKYYLNVNWINVPVLQVFPSNNVYI